MLSRYNAESKSCCRYRKSKTRICPFCDGLHFQVDWALWFRSTIVITFLAGIQYGAIPSFFRLLVRVEEHSLKLRRFQIISCEDPTCVTRWWYKLVISVAVWTFWKRREFIDADTMAQLCYGLRILQRFEFLATTMKTVHHDTVEIACLHCTCVPLYTCPIMRLYVRDCIPARSLKCHSTHALGAVRILWVAAHRSRKYFD